VHFSPCHRGLPDRKDNACGQWARNRSPAPARPENNDAESDPLYVIAGFDAIGELCYGVDRGRQVPGTNGTVEIKYVRRSSSG